MADHHVHPAIHKHPRVSYVWYRSVIDCSWNVMAHGDAGRGIKGKTGEWSGQPVLFTLPRNMMYPALLPLMRTTRLPEVDWTDAPADLNGLVRFAGRRNQVYARVPSHFNCSLQPLVLSLWSQSPFYIYVECTSGPTMYSSAHCNIYPLNTRKRLRWYRVNDPWKPYKQLGGNFKPISWPQHQQFGMTTPNERGTLHGVIWRIVLDVSKALFFIICSFWVIPRPLSSNCRRFGTDCRFHLHRQAHSPAHEDGTESEFRNVAN